jgi:hypothetical protein
MPNKTYIFWKYDLFPHVLWAEVEKMEDGKFYLKGWQGAYRTKNTCLAILSEAEAQRFIQLFTAIKNGRDKVLDEFDISVKSILAELKHA